MSNTIKTAITFECAASAGEIKFMTDASEQSNSNTYVIHMLMNQPVVVKQHSENEVTIAVTGDWEFSELAQALQVFKKAIP